ncbi:MULTISPECIES: hypothetical protein [Bacillus]|jgi:hypothetical protein|uniref:hypothetical protein n=1 Tax=Bacillus TaxID=1386 RepID=UPI0002D3670D|nr:MULTISPECIES: hypothetical protein [Bacillus]ARC71948.1 hypothetical protein B34_04611 [Bacillus licheniformis]AYC51167.1 hypothetical protein C7M53_07830 [Bacillus licheniformis]MCD2488020.1 hypothetical protein [Bacillus licheniformis]MCD2525038.1 hypothetical protein [Bacillus licheniformis]MCP8972913.1 hypothetical protein [Bacillus licheniformis]
MEENNGVGVSLTREGKTLMISNNPYYYNQMIELKADGPTQQAVPLPRFMRYLVDIFGYDAIKKAIDEFPQEIRCKTALERMNDEGRDLDY